MRRLLKIREFFDLKKRDLEGDDSDTHRPAKRQRKGVSKSASFACIPVKSSKKDQKDYERFLLVFENEKAKESIWWLPGRRGEAFAMHRERFEHSLLLKIDLEEHSFTEFVGNLKRWGFQQMNIPSLSGRVLAFEKTSSDEKGCNSSSKTTSTKECKEPGRRNHPQGHHSVSTGLPTHTTQPHQGDSSLTSLNLANMSSLQLQQAQHMVQQEIAQTYFTLLWQELQRQLSVLLLQQSQTARTQLAAAPSSGILDLAALLHQQQVQQQVMAAQFFRAANVHPSTPEEQQRVVEELGELQRQQLSNLTYQIVALVAANLEQQNQNSLPDAPMIHRILVKYMIALVLLQLQQQQHNLEFLRQERLTWLASVRPVNSEESGILPEPLNTLQMQQLLSEAAMLSLSRAHQLLCEASILIPDAVNPPESTWVPPAPTPGNHHPLPGSDLPQGPRPPFPGSGLAQGPPRTTTAP